MSWETKGKFSEMNALKAFAAAAKDFVLQRDSPVRVLKSGLEYAHQKGAHYAAHPDVKDGEFDGRLRTELAGFGWPDASTDLGDKVQNVFDLAKSRAEDLTTVPTRIHLRSAAEPAINNSPEATAFVLRHAGDVRHAVDEVTKSFDRENKRPTQYHSYAQKLIGPGFHG